METRPPYQSLWKDLAAEKSMIFLSGPRQVGKTTFMRELIAKKYPHTTYFNWDIVDDKKTLLKDPYFFQATDTEGPGRPLVILDEIHKYRHWKNYLKGVYDKFHGRFSFAVLGSGRLDIGNRTGDAMTGRFLEMHLFPFTIAELFCSKADIKQFLKDPFSGMDLVDAAKSASGWQELFNLGGFPEPFLSGKESAWRRWSANYGRQIIREDMRSLNEIRLIDDIETLFSLLPAKVGSPVSINNLASDLGVSFPAVKNWLDLFDYFYLTFRISPWTKKISRAILKEKKLYLFNYPQIVDPAARFENMVALELLRAVRSWNEWGWGDFGLYYLRNKDKKEVDFLLTKDHVPFLAIETKLTDTTPSPSLMEFQSVLKVPAVQLVHTPGTVRRMISGKSGDIGIFSASRWLATLP
jgi:predicted AAA+ superfamily ATPase